MSLGSQGRGLSAPLKEKPPPSSSLRKNQTMVPERRMQHCSRLHQHSHGLWSAFGNRHRLQTAREIGKGVTFLPGASDFRQATRLIRIQSLVESQVVSKKLTRYNIGKGSE
jgi:hypothetical protein